MDAIIACMICGDAGTDSMLASAVVAGGLSVPWMLRDRLFEVARRVWRPVRPSAECDQERCAVANEDDSSSSL